MKKPSKKQLAAAFISLLVVTSVFGVWLRYRTTQKALSAFDEFETYMHDNGKWSVPNPLRTGWNPGTLLIVDENGTNVYVDSSALFTDLSAVKRDSAAISDIKLSLRGNDKTKFGIFRDNSEVVSNDDITLEVEFGNISTQYIELMTIEDAIKKSKTVMEKANKSKVFVITDTLRSSKMRIARQANIHSSSVGDFDTKDVKAKVKLKTAAESKSILESDGELLIGYKVRRIGIEGNVMGPAKDPQPRLLNPTAEQAKQIGELIEVDRSFSKCIFETPVHVLAIGMSDYSISENGLVGGALSDMPYSAKLVADAFLSAFSNNVNCSVDTIIPSFENTGVARKKMSKADLLQRVNAWKEKNKQKMRPESNRPVNAVQILYYCGHGYRNSITGLDCLIPEQYLDKDNKFDAIESTELCKTSNGIATILILDTCRTNDDQLNRLMKSTALPFSRTNPAPAAMSRQIQEMLRRNFPDGLQAMYNSTVNGKTTEVVEYSIGGAERKIGPLAILINENIDKVTHTNENITLTQFLSLLLSDITYRNVNIIKSISENNRNDFINDRAVNFDSTVLISKR